MTTTKPSNDNDNKNDARLTLVAIPRHYHLHYTKIDLVHHVFAGIVEITLDGLDESNTVILHSLELNLESAFIKEVEKKRVGSQDDGSSGDDGSGSGGISGKKQSSSEAIEFVYTKKDQTCRIRFEDDQDDKDDGGEKSSSSPIKAGSSYILTIQFTGILNGSMHGLYRSTYKTLNGTVCTMATTQFEPTDARRAFPCFDEPALKATFQLVVTFPYLSPQSGQPLSCLSNTPTISEETTYYPTSSSYTKTFKFDITPKMSTYLLALIVGELDCISQTSVKTGIRTSVYTVPGKTDQGRFCLQTASQCLDLFSDLFEVPYPLQKSDLIAIPDFAAGAMENWGCVTYREAKILVKKGSTSETTKRGIARTVCHELAHMWFGNLATMEFWTQLWLKEGVARYMEFVGIDTLFPEWDAWTEFVHGVCGLALSLDSMASSHPVEVEVHHPDEINEIFDAISYAKGASIVRMVASYIGFDKFREGMALYLKRNAYGNATTPMLWGALQEVSSLPVVELMSPWTSQVGFPLVVLPGEAAGKIETPRFLSSGPDKNKEESSAGRGHAVWPIPVTAFVEGEDDVQGPWIVNGEDDQSSVLVSKMDEWTAAGKWFKLNASQTGFYRVAYTSDQWRQLAKIMSPSGPLSATDRLGLLSDSFSAGMAGYSPVIDALALAAQFSTHDDAEYAVWEELSDNLSSLASLYRNEAFYGKFQTFLGNIYRLQLKKLGWEACANESQRTGTLRATVIRMLGIAKDEEARAEALRRFRRYVENPHEYPISGDIRRVVFKVALSEDEGDVYNSLRSMYESTSFPEEQRDCLMTMGCVRDMGRHAEMMDYILFSRKVRLQDVAFPLNALASTSDEGGRACWHFFSTNFDKLWSTFGSGPLWGSLVALCVRGLRTRGEVEEVKGFFYAEDTAQQHPVGSGKMRLSRAMEVVETRADRLERDREQVATFLSQMQAQ